MKFIQQLFGSENNEAVVIGADVIHPSAKGGASLVQPSVAAVVCSVDKFVSQWAHCVRAQCNEYGRSAACEQIGTAEGPLFKEMFDVCMKSWREWRGADPQKLPPRHVIILRDGVSNEQITSVVDAEIAQIKDWYREEAAKLGMKNPETFVKGMYFTVVIVQKRHNTRIFTGVPLADAEEEEDERGGGEEEERGSVLGGSRPPSTRGPGSVAGSVRGGRGGRGGPRRGRGFQPNDLRAFGTDPQGGVQNPEPGTILDGEVENLMLPPDTKSFWLCSHKSTIGTAHPALYIIREDALLSASDPSKRIGLVDLQLLIYHLCHLSQRTSKAISYPVPAFYADMLAEKATKHLWLERFGWRSEAQKLRRAQKGMGPLPAGAGGGFLSPEMGADGKETEESKRQRPQRMQEATATLRRAAREHANATLVKTIPRNCPEGFPTEGGIAQRTCGRTFFI
uniref:Piwi domain-containing protein n=1 Tax=Chromera velia CCMP2878 TaxID=1169474 RepID=A0A0G4I1L1_9ALVE|eukprot:Cvel_10148.t1-p1 / transcript=Cvel_10148.t1 / gene=Cvel_10148 / organism=Chromera_velia_CCMP2878 / gene_product=Protein argonaute 2, putative / transcript_product=Protein argonaute 2, putative / location=Cvel_scaffold605:45652-47571(-) / protein_length=451 / sequence_SO=supercontig / SO=protein_coding / is_pseudo=false